MLVLLIGEKKRRAIVLDLLFFYLLPKAEFSSG